MKLTSVWQFPYLSALREADRRVTNIAPFMCINHTDSLLLKSIEAKKKGITQVEYRVGKILRLRCASALKISSASKA